MNKSALICGITGQDGSYLAHFLLNKGYEVWGTSRDAMNANQKNLVRLGINDDVKILSMDVKDFRSVYSVINKVQPDEVYYLSGQSSVGLSFELPSETIESIVIGTLNLLEICRISQKSFKLYHAGSSECFGSHEFAVNESSSFYPKSPYAVAKSSAFWLVNNYREAYGLNACTGILFNHESVLRPERFVTQKIIRGVKAIVNGEMTRLQLGNLDIIRDWGWSPEYVVAMWKMLQQDNLKDYIVATGNSYSLKEFIQLAFEYYDLDWTQYVVASDVFLRPSDIMVSRADPSLIYSELGWKAQTQLPQIVQKMLNDEIF